jgi:integrase
MKLTQKTIAALTLAGGKAESIVFDDDLAGFGIRIRAGGSRTWIYQYKIGHQNRRVTLGSLAALTPAQARDTAAEMHAMVRLGRDPAGEKTEGRARAAETMGAVTRSYLTYQTGHLRRRSYVELERHLLGYCKPLHGLQLQKIDRRTVAARIADIAGSSGAATGNRVRASLSALFAWGMRQGLLDTNPVTGTNRQPEQSRTRVLSDAELKIIWDVLGSDDYSAIIRLLVLTGQRRDEIGSLCWSEVTDDQIVLPPQRTKNNRGHRIPIVPAVRAILEGRERSSVFVFGRHPAKPFSGWGVSKAGLDRRIKEAGHRLEPWRLHDLRRSLSTAMHDELGVPPHVVEAVLNHVSGHKAGVAGIYNRAVYEREARIALTRWADHVLAVVEGHAPTVVPLRA